MKEAAQINDPKVRAEYEELITNGKVLLDNGTEIIYDENTYYMVFEDGTK